MSEAEAFAVFIVLYAIAFGTVIWCEVEARS
jgi:hypothetical protein